MTQQDSGHTQLHSVANALGCAGAMHQISTRHMSSSRPYLCRQDVNRLRVQGVQTQLAPPLGFPSRV